MASLMPFADEYVVMDCGSTDGSLEVLQSLASKNPRIRIVHSSFDIPGVGPDASIFAIRANDVIAECKNDLVLYHQSDEIFHEDLLDAMRCQLELLNDGIPEGWKGMNFWRLQLRDNLQKISWYPHPVNRLDLKARMNHVGDGMNTDRPWDPPFVGGYDGGATWDASYRHDPPSLPLNHMILDIGRKGMFLENIYNKSLLHSKYWREEPCVEGMPADAWVAKERLNIDWQKKFSPFDIPKIIRGLLGETSYIVRPEILELIANDKGINHA
jgi:glycosyltransferase involved in cell wall biosynthesis